LTPRSMTKKVVGVFVRFFVRTLILQSPLRERPVMFGIHRCPSSDACCDCLRDMLTVSLVKRRRGWVGPAFHSAA
jgi:hypothetical protein